MAIWAIILLDDRYHGGMALWHPLPKDSGAPARTLLSAFVEAPQTFLAKYCQVLLGNDISRKSFPANDPPGCLERETYRQD